MGAAGEAMLDNMNSTSWASILSTLFPSARMIGVVLDMREVSAIRMGEGLAFSASRRAAAPAVGDASCGAKRLARGLRL